MGNLMRSSTEMSVITRDDMGKEKVYYVNVGRFIIKKAPAIMKAVLGSCIGLCIWDPIEKIGGVAHIFMDRSEGKEYSASQPVKYADQGTTKFLEKFRHYGCKKFNLEAKVFGGCNMMGKENNTMGKRIFNIVEGALKKKHIPITYMDVGGRTGRHITFNISTGKVLIKKLAMED